MSSILLIQGQTLLTDLYYHELIKSTVLAASTFQVRRVMIASGHAMESVATELQLIKEIESGVYKAVIVFDLDWDQNFFMDLLGSALRRFVTFRAGRIAFPTTGVTLLPALVELFNVPWVSAECYANTWGAWQSSAAAIELAFPITRFIPNSIPSSQLQLSGKAFTLLNVTASDRCFGVTRDSEFESIFISRNHDDDDSIEANSSEGEAEDVMSDSRVSTTQGAQLWNFHGIIEDSNSPWHPTSEAGPPTKRKSPVAYSASDDNRTTTEGSAHAEQYGASENSHVIIALRRFGAGSICYFGDVNCEPATADLL